MKNFLSCDWGTSSFRLRYVDADTLTFSSAVSPDKGIAKTYESWKQSGRKDEERFSFYLDAIKDHISLLEKQLKFSVKNTPLIISGMAISSIGMIDIPYKQFPFMADGSDLEVMKKKASTGFDHDILLISGAKTDNDAMRGEETQLAGCVHPDEEERLFIFPGTHSKHIRVKNSQVADIKTYMTGEFFDILSRKSLLSVSVEEGEGLKSNNNNVSFGQGVTDSTRSNLLHAVFSVRTNDLFNKLSKQENYYYLSGLLIGTELRDVTESLHKKITLVVNEGMKQFYTTALKVLGVQEDERSLGIENADIALIKGQIKIWDNFIFCSEKLHS
jgi:2-dehydro-3-deoxygalactonokinase